MQDMQLKKKAKDRRVLFGDAWESCLVMARAIANVFGSANLDELIDFDTIWADNETLEDLQKKKDLGVPQETIWSEAGYSQEQIAVMKKTDEYRLDIMGQIWPWISKSPEAQEILTQLLNELGWQVKLSAPTPNTIQVDASGQPIPNPAGETTPPADNQPGQSPATSGVTPEGSITNGPNTGRTSQSGS
jgi:hypothetical protein